MPKERKAISKRTRFEVFKRDSFKCQYCGGCSPEVLLVIDHIKPVADGGDNHLLNLITACDPCNAGKSDVPLSDGAAVSKQVAQLHALAERREQLEMLMKWREGLASIDDDMVQILVGKVNDRMAAFNQNLNAYGVGRVRSWLKRFGFENSLQGISNAFEAEDPEAMVAQMEQFSAAAAKVAREPELRDFWRLRARMRARRFRYGQEWAPIQKMRSAFSKGWTIADMDRAMAEAEDYEHFLSLIGYE